MSWVILITAHPGTVAQVLLSTDTMRGCVEHMDLQAREGRSCLLREERWSMRQLIIKLWSADSQAAILDMIVIWLQWQGILDPITAMLHAWCNSLEVVLVYFSV